MYIYYIIILYIYYIFIIYYIFANKNSILAKILTIQSMCICLNVKDCFFPVFRKISRKTSSFQVYTSVFLDYNTDVSISK